MDDIRKTVASLESPNVPVVKKRCLMKMTLGDYRQNMEIEKRKVPLGIYILKIIPYAVLQNK